MKEVKKFTCVTIGGEKTAKRISAKEVHKRLKKCQELSSGEYAKWLDEEVAANVSRLIWKTAHLVPWEQAEH